MDLSNFFSSRQKRIDCYMSELLEELPFQSSSLLSAMKYGVLLGGKRIRPILMYIIGEIFKVDLHIIDVLASSVEFIHAYSLIHDDLPSLDGDLLRRGKDACHVKFGESTAILAGNSLQCLAFNILSNLNVTEVSDSKKIKIISELSKASGVTGMCIGQFLDLESKNKTIKLHELEKIYWYKTGFLINSAIRLVLIVSCKCKKRIFFALEEYSKNISFAFQIKDDILDFKSDICRVQSSLSSNQCFKGNTFPLIIGLEHSKKKLIKLYEEALMYLKILSDECIDIKLLEQLAFYIITRNK
ncbi:MAG: polyprenyl synthetase family protein [Buchnera aphidicola (Meitanaphis microgallis)]